MESGPQERTPGSTHMRIGIVAPSDSRSSLRESIRTLKGPEYRWVLYQHEGEVREGVRTLLAREAIDGMYLGAMPYDRCRDILPPDLPLAVPQLGAIELAITVARAVAGGWPAAPVSIDTIDEQAVKEVARALGLDRELVASLPHSRDLSVDDIVRFHSEFSRRTGQGYAVTGRTDVARLLEGRVRYVNAYRVPSSDRAVLHELALRIQADKDSQRHLAAGVFRVMPGDSPHNAERDRVQLMHLLMSTPEFADAWVENRGTRGVVTFAHKALLERATDAWTVAPRIGTGDVRLGFSVAAGFGLGASARSCVLLAEHAADLAEREGGGRAYLMGDRGLIVGPMALGASPLAFTYQEHGQALESLAGEVGLSALSLSRLAALERRLGGRPISPSELAEALAINDRSGRRLMRALATGGLVADAGTSQKKGGKGRPSHLWRLQVASRGRGGDAG
jgi:hypothetical protein